MGMARLNIWVTDIDNPCSISPRTWYVTIYDCDGNVLEWCGRRFVVLPARCGHLEIDVPPGCYRINAVWSFWIGGGVIYVNHFTDSAVVQACCDQHNCVTLFNPSTHRCGVIFLRALRDLVEQKALKADLVQPVEQAVGNVLEFLPRPVRGFEIPILDEMEKLVRAQEAEAEKGAND